jgi:hypothetical protein
MMAFESKLPADQIEKSSDSNDAARANLSNEAFSAAIKAFKDPGEFITFTANQFTRIDTNRDGAITMAEINIFAARPKMKPEQIALASVLKEHFDRLAGLAGSAQSVGVDDLKDFAKGANPTLCGDSVSFTGTVARGAAGGAAGGAIVGGLSRDGSALGGAKDGAAIGAAVGALAYGVAKVNEHNAKKTRAAIASWGYFNLEACK